MKRSYRELRIKNLRYNIALFSLVTSASLVSIGSFAFALSTNPEIKTYHIKEIDIDYDNMPISTNKMMNVEYQPEITTQKKEYSGMNLSNTLEEEIKKISEIYGVPYQIVLTIGERESAGKWNNNGVISDTNDYGEFQINECNLSYIEENLGYKKEEILNDPIKNAEACIFLLRDIINREDINTVTEIFGMYNGWVGWENKPLAINYSVGCSQILNDYFPEFEYKENKKYNNL